MQEAFTIREHLGSFVCKMEEKLARKDSEHPEGWLNDHPLDLFSRADDRMDRLYAAIEQDEDPEVIGELAVDVANWMSMIADNVGYLSDI